MAFKILAVDDEKNILRLVKVNLQKEGYEVATATTGREALQQIERDQPDLVIMDVMMPEMGGFEALREMKSNPESAEIPVIMLTAKAQDADVFKGWKSGADLYLTKPFNPQELLTFVKRILQDKTKDDGAYHLDESESFDLSDIDAQNLDPKFLPPSSQ